MIHGKIKLSKRYVIGAREIQAEYERVIDAIDELSRLFTGVRRYPYTGGWIPFGMKRLAPLATQGHASGGKVAGGEEDAEGDLDNQCVRDKGDEGVVEDRRPMKKRR